MVNRRAVIGITNQRIIIEPTVVSADHKYVNLFYQDIQSIEEGTIKRSIGAQPIVVDIGLRNNIGYSVYTTSTYKSETRNLLRIMKSAFQSFQSSEL